MPSQISYRYLFPGTEPTIDELSTAELISVQQVEDVEDMARHAVGDVVQVPDTRYVDEERSFKVVSVGDPTSSRFVGEPSTAIDNPNVYVTDAEQARASHDTVPQPEPIGPGHPSGSRPLCLASAPSGHILDEQPSHRS